MLWLLNLGKLRSRERLFDSPETSLDWIRIEYIDGWALVGVV
jgi:hypothetical protein